MPYGRVPSPELTDDATPSGREAAMAIRRVLDDPAASYWLKHALRSALDRDVVDAAHDAETLVGLLRGRCAASLEMPASPGEEACDGVSIGGISRR